MSSILSDIIAEALEPDPDYTVDAWADNYRVLSSVSASEPGRYRTDRVPYAREIMYELSPRSRAQRIIFMKGAQIGATEIGNNAIGFYIHQSPGPILFVQPTLDMAKRNSKQRIQPMVDACPALSEKITDRRSRDSGNTMLAKEFPGGILVLTGANSAIGLRSIPSRILILDEIDAYERDISGEGDAIALAIKRTETFRNRRKIFEISTPTNEGLSRIEADFELSDKRYFNVQCPFCGDFAPITWKRIVWEKTADGIHLPETAALACENCGETISESYKTKLLEGGKWIATNPGPDRWVGFHLSALYSPLGWYSWADAVRDFLAAKKQPSSELRREALKTWTNTCLGETWSDPALTVNRSKLYLRRERYEKTIPAPVLCCTAGIDVQADRIEITVEGWADAEERYTLFHRVIWGPPEQPTNEVWQNLDDVLETPYEHEAGGTMRIAAATIDSGYLATTVYEWVKPRQGRRIYATKGFAGAGRPIVTAPTQKKTGRSRVPVRLFTIGTDSAKNLIYRRLLIEEPGPGYHHFPIDPSIDEEYFEQLTAERREIKYVKGFPVEEWKLARPRNEALDCSVQSLAALIILNPIWSALEARRQTEPEETPEPESKVSFPRRRGFVSNWKG